VVHPTSLLIAWRERAAYLEQFGDPTSARLWRLAAVELEQALKAHGAETLRRAGERVVIQYHRRAGSFKRLLGASPQGTTCFAQILNCLRYTRVIGFEQLQLTKYSPHRADGRLKDRQSRRQIRSRVWFRLASRLRLVTTELQDGPHGQRTTMNSAAKPRVYAVEELGVSRILRLSPFEYFVHPSLKAQALGPRAIPVKFPVRASVPKEVAYLRPGGDHALS